MMNSITVKVFEEVDRLFTAVAKMMRRCVAGYKIRRGHFDERYGRFKQSSFE